jgi:hypothetical protein
VGPNFLIYKIIIATPICCKFFKPINLTWVKSKAKNYDSRNTWRLHCGKRAVWLFFLKEVSGCNMTKTYQGRFCVLRFQIVFFFHSILSTLIVKGTNMGDLKMQTNRKDSIRFET